MIAIIIIRFKFTTTPPRPLTYYHTYPLDVYHVIIQAVALRLLRDGVLHRPWRSVTSSIRNTHSDPNTCDPFQVGGI